VTILHCFLTNDILLNRNFAMFPSSGVHIWELSLVDENWNSNFCAQIVPISLSSHSKLCIQTFSLKCSCLTVMFTLWWCLIILVHLLCTVHSTGSNSKELDQEAVASMPAMLAAIYHNPQNTEVNWEQSQKILILHFLGAKEVLRLIQAICWKVRWLQDIQLQILFPQICHLCFDLLSNEKYVRKKNSIVKQQYFTTLYLMA